MRRPVSGFAVAHTSSPTSGIRHYAANAKYIVQCTMTKSIGQCREIFTDARRVENQAVEEAVGAERQRAFIRRDAVLGAERALDLEARAG